MAVKSIIDMNIKGKRVFLRVDFNVPLGGGNVRDDTRIRRSLPTISYALDQGARLVVASHLGRPKGERNPAMSLQTVAQKLGDLLVSPVQFADDCIGPDTEQTVKGLSNGELVVLENLRFYNGETENDPEFSRQLATLADVYINDAFGTAHRAHASTVGVPALLRTKGAGMLMKEELESLEKAFSNPDKPVVALFGGAKVSDKLGVLENLLDQMETVLIGGGMANTFLKAKGIGVGASKVEEDMLDIAADILAKAEKAHCRLILPVDLVTAEKMEATAATTVVEAGAVPEGQMALDIGPRTVELFRKEVAEAGTIVWNGPMGVFELDNFKMGTRTLARAVGWAPGFTVVGGGDTVRAVKDAAMSHKISYISTGGGAFMEFLEGKTLPGVAALDM
jgi:phosphoglycerate kinase